ncbi:unnamed protein product, partial [Sphacelaria rigidula]
MVKPARRLKGEVRFHAPITEFQHKPRREADSRCRSEGIKMQNPWSRTLNRWVIFTTVSYLALLTAMLAWISTWALESAQQDSRGAEYDRRAQLGLVKESGPLNRYFDTPGDCVSGTPAEISEVEEMLRPLSEKCFTYRSVRRLGVPVPPTVGQTFQWCYNNTATLHWHEAPTRHGRGHRKELDLGTRTNLAIHRFGSKAPEETSRTGGGSNDDDDYADFYDDENFGALAAVTEYFSGGSLCEAAEGESEGGGSSNTWGVTVRLWSCKKHSERV